MSAPTSVSTATQSSTVHESSRSGEGRGDRTRPRPRRRADVTRRREDGKTHMTYGGRALTVAADDAQPTSWPAGVDPPCSRPARRHRRRGRAAMSTVRNLLRPGPPLPARHASLPTAFISSETSSNGHPRIHPAALLLEFRQAVEDVGDRIDSPGLRDIIAMRVFRMAWNEDNAAGLEIAF